jgi:hypothetical protein
MNEKLYNLVIILFFGFLIIYVMHPEPKILYKKNYLKNCNIKQNINEICIEE